MHGVQAVDARLQGWAEYGIRGGALVRPVPGDGGREARLWVLHVFRLSRCLWATIPRRWLMQPLSQCRINVYMSQLDDKGKKIGQLLFFSPWWGAGYSPSFILHMYCVTKTYHGDEAVRHDVV